MNTIDISSTLGLSALGALTVNIALGVVIWSRKRINLPLGIPLLKAHKFTGYTAAVLILAHVGLIPLDPASGFKWKDLLLPLWTKHQPYIITLGTLAFYLLAVVVASSYFKKKLKYKHWRKLHYLSYVAALAFIVHGMWIDPDLKDRPVDWLDGEKIFVEACVVMIFGISVFRLRIKKENHPSP